MSASYGRLFSRFTDLPQYTKNANNSPSVQNSPGFVPGIMAHFVDHLPRRKFQKRQLSYPDSIPLPHYRENSSLLYFPVDEVPQNRRTQMHYSQLQIKTGILPFLPKKHQHGKISPGTPENP